MVHPSAFWSEEEGRGRKKRSRPRVVSRPRLPIPSELAMSFWRSVRRAENPPPGAPACQRCRGVQLMPDRPVLSPRGPRGVTCRLATLPRGCDSLAWRSPPRPAVMRTWLGGWPDPSGFRRSRLPPRAWARRSGSIAWTRVLALLPPSQPA